MLSPYRALDLTDDKGFLCGKILADLGAEVIKVERPGGDPSRNIGPFYHDIPDLEKSLFWFAYNNNKRGITLNIETKDGQEVFKELVRGADFVIESFPVGHMDSLGLGYSVLSEVNPRIIMTSITPFGQTGPYKEYKASDIVAWAMGGMMYLTGDPDRPPVQVSFPQAYLLTSAVAAAGSLIAHYYREITGEGQHVDVSAQPAVIWALMGARLTWDLIKVIQRRSGPRRAGITLATQRQTWACKDGYVSFMIVGGPPAAPVNRALVDWMDSECMADGYLRAVDWDTLNASAAPQEFFDRIEEPIGKFFMAHTMDELITGAVERRVLIYPVATAKGIMEDLQLTARGFWGKVEHPELDVAMTYPGSFVKASKTPCRIRHRAPLIGEHNDEIYQELRFPQERSSTFKRGGSYLRKQVFEGIRVADFSWSFVGPLAARYLADYGATVVHVESITHPDICRVSQPFKDAIPGVNRSGIFANANCNKYGITLNLNKPQGIEIAKRIIAWADIMLESFTPGTIDKWGLDYDSVKKINPEIIYLSTSMRGQTGPHAKEPGYGLQLVGLAGFTHITGWPDRGPTQPYGAYTDVVSIPFGVAALISALDYRRRTGKGQYLDLSQYEVGVQFLAPLLLDYTVNGRIAARMGNSHPHAAPHNAYPCRGDDRWVAIAVFSDEEWQAFCQVVGKPAWTGDPKFATLLSRKQNEEELDRLVTEWTINFTPEEIMARMQAAGVAAGVVENTKDIHDDPQLKYRHHFQLFDHPEIGYHSVDSLPFQLSRTPSELKMCAPLMGEHNEYVYTQILGMPSEELVKLLAEGVFD